MEIWWSLINSIGRPSQSVISAPASDQKSEGFIPVDNAIMSIHITISFEGHKTALSRPLSLCLYALLSRSKAPWGCWWILPYGPGWRLVLIRDWLGELLVKGMSRWSCKSAESYFRGWLAFMRLTGGFFNWWGLSPSFLPCIVRISWSREIRTKRQTLIKISDITLEILQLRKAFFFFITSCFWPYWSWNKRWPLRQSAKTVFLHL